MVRSCMKEGQKREIITGISVAVVVVVAISLLTVEIANDFDGVMGYLGGRQHVRQRVIRSKARLTTINDDIIRPV